MRNAGASIDPPPDPASATPSADQLHPVRSNTSSLPPGVSADIFGEGAPRLTPAAPQTGGGSNLPPPATPVEPWPVADATVQEEPAPFETELGPEDRSPAGRYWIVALAVLLVLLYLGSAVSMSGGILQGTTVLGVEIGGLSPSDAVLNLREKLYGRTHAPVVVMQGSERIAVNPDDAGLRFDAEATVRQAPTGFPSPLEVWRAFTGGTQLEPVITVDQVKLEAAVARDVGESLEDPAREGGVRFDGTTPVPVYPHAGYTIDKTVVGRDIQRAYLTPDITVRATTVKNTPQVGRDAVQRAVVWAKHAVASPITLTEGGKAVELPPIVLASHLTFVPEGHSLRPKFEAAEIAPGIERRLIEPGAAARSATFTIEDDRPVLVHAREGRRLDTGRMATDMIAALGGGSRTVPVSLLDAPPVVTDQDAVDLGVKEKIGEFTTSYPCCVPRTANIQAATRVVNYQLVRPGQTFSFNELVGRRDAAEGYGGGYTSTMIRGQAGSDVAGMSQVATTIFNAMVRAGLDDIDRTPSEVYMPQYPEGMDAAVSYPAPDLKWKNETPYGVLIHATATDTAVTVELWSTKRYDVEIRGPVKTAVTQAAPIAGTGPQCVPSSGQPGFTAEVTRTLRRDGKVEAKQSFKTVYRPQPAVTCPTAG
ncbi:vanomycin resistance protein VanB [Planotetraspora thailandica]|uniref:Vanomycin resistance protein VanB n=1 Tax=Planotetraspora thailandica TaxID=487172 RepID=A0A8J3V6C5_9ACTN|nr:VanW family protein [Planotetraspora thailandica]GII55756.1 vanomycin resistance protein VanB [Planotetraspora thailandica]